MSRPQFSPYQVITSGDMSGNLTSQVSIIQKLSEISYSVSWSGTPTGTFSVQVSNDYSENSDGSVNNSGTWTDMTLTGSPAAAGSSGSGFIDIVGTGAYAIRLAYIAGSGSGTLNAIINAKVS